MCTNAMYDSLKREIDASVSPYSTKDTIVLNIYESSGVGSDVRESVLVGFNRYITQYRKREISELRSHFAIFLSMFFIGVLTEFLLYKVFSGAIAEWIVNTLDIFAWVFIWQFAAYMTFEFAKDVKTVRRLSQILRIEYVFRHWE